MRKLDVLGASGWHVGRIWTDRPADFLSVKQNAAQSSLIARSIQINNGALCASVGDIWRFLYSSPFVLLSFLA